MTRNIVSSKYDRASEAQCASALRLGWDTRFGSVVVPTVWLRSCEDYTDILRLTDFNNEQFKHWGEADSWSINIEDDTQVWRAFSDPILG